jgi:hypothetical protein
VAHASEPDVPSLRSNAVLNFEMAGLHSDLDSETCERENTASVNEGFAGYLALR